MQNACDTTLATLNNDAVHFLTNDALNPEVDPETEKARCFNYPMHLKTKY